MHSASPWGEMMSLPGGVESLLYAYVSLTRFPADLPESLGPRHALETKSLNFTLAKNQVASLVPFVSRITLHLDRVKSIELDRLLFLVRKSSFHDDSLVCYTISRRDQWTDSLKKEHQRYGVPRAGKTDCRG